MLYTNKALNITQNFSPKLQALYFDEPVNIDQRINTFLTKARNFLETYETTAGSSIDVSTNSDLLYLNNTAPHDLLDALNRVTEQYQNEAEATLLHFKRIETLILLGALGIIFLEIIFVFWPMLHQYTKAQKERATAVNKALSSENMLENVVQNIPAILFAKDVKEGYKYNIINKAAAEFFGYSSKEMMGKTDYDFFNEEEANFFRNTDIGVIAGGKVVDIPCEQVTTKHGTMLAHTRKVPIKNSDGEPTMLLGIVQDITERRRNEIELQKYREKLEEMVEDRTEKLKVAVEKQKS